MPQSDQAPYSADTAQWDRTLRLNRMPQSDYVFQTTPALRSAATHDRATQTLPTPRPVDSKVRSRPLAPRDNRRRRNNAQPRARIPRAIADRASRQTVDQSPNRRQTTHQRSSTVRSMPPFAAKAGERW